jgi:hypothetical protein
VTDVKHAITQTNTQSHKKQREKILLSSRSSVKTEKSKVAENEEFYVFLIFFFRVVVYTCACPEPLAQAPPLK